ncbi:transporter substrate-binding domain-containing protein [Rhizobium sp. YIM 134829]|uniref:transporter substrate-binding domain-containing protein n=1 Tax=Rhizobium sp. YIM 134829 TaxID=3390453 RepID=UPI00397B9003
MLALGGIAGPALAQERVKDLPLAFDSRERIAKPDLSAVPRLRFLTTVDFPPFNFIDQSGRLSGFHVDLAREICRVLEIQPKCQIQAMTFEELQPALNDRQGEVVMAGIAVTEELRRSFAFSRPFLQLPARFAANRAAFPSVPTIKTLLSRPVGVVAGTTHEAMLKAFFPGQATQSFADRAALLSALKQGQVASVFSDSLQLAFWTTGSEAAGCCTLVGDAYLSQRFLGEGLSLMTRKDDPDLTQALDHALLDLSRTGRLNEIYLRYFPTGIY